jgi:hypothetical protein
MNGQCLITSCKCIGGLFGSRCQFSNTTISELQNVQGDILNFLTNAPFSSDSLTMLQMISETTAVANESNVQKGINLIDNFRA